MTHKEDDGLKHGKAAQAVTKDVFKAAIKALAKRDVCVTCGAITLLHAIIGNMLADAKESGGPEELVHLTINLCAGIVDLSIEIEGTDLTQLGESFDAEEYLKKFRKGKDNEDN